MGLLNLRISLLISVHYSFLGRQRRPYKLLFSDLGSCMASCSCIYNIIYIYISVTKWRRSGFLEFTKLLLALSSFAQPFDRMISIQKHYFIILNHRQACAGRSREETAGKRRGPVTKWPPQRLLFTRLEIVFVIISSFTKRTKFVHE